MSLLLLPYEPAQCSYRLQLPSSSWLLKASSARHVLPVILHVTTVSVYRYGKSATALRIVQMAPTKILPSVELVPEMFQLVRSLLQECNINGSFITWMCTYATAPIAPQCPSMDTHLMDDCALSRLHEVLTAFFLLKSYPATCGAMNSGEFIFEIERRFDGLSIWLYGHANNRKWFSAPKDYNELLIRPSDWYHDMAIQFSDSSVDLTRSDASAQVMYKAEHGPLHFLFCNSSECTNIRIVPCAEGGGGQQRKFRYDSCNAEGVFCNGGAGSFCEYEESWPTGVYIFDVTLKEPQRQSRSVEIRLRGAGPFAFDSVGEGHTRLRIRPGNWISDMPVQFVAMPGSTSTVTTPISTPVTFPSTSSTSTSALPEQTTTTETTPTTKSSWPPLPAPSTCDPRYAYLLIPEPGRCDGYRICLSGRSSGATCPPPLLFSYHLQDCALPNYVDC
ncbi:uncharacterized protein LOC113214433 isoform X3 [Frankliniella occidentalis]|uniref:Uncharacterized protein LOC113214433 isoform X3 n=1 Tax=Frankliniella occidentalis TaxID=133901 RepID=A0A9C6X481_FRAOC|nr:uncharacterized protein LOC113214433 isoform X3 [Frankliniella occidentalis]